MTSQPLLTLVLACWLTGMLGIFMLIQYTDTLPFKFSCDKLVLQQEKEPASDKIKLIRGIRRAKPGFLTIGLCSVPRKSVSYLEDTLYSLINHLTDIEKQYVVIVLFLGSLDEDWLNETLAFIDKDFTKEIQLGLLQVVQPTQDIYPNFTQITWEKKENIIPQARVHWIVKQNIDFAYLFGYCAKLNTYYMHVEDDILAAADYIKHLQAFVSRAIRSPHYWFMISVSKLGFIGKIFRSSDLERMKQYFLLFREEQPGDMLIRDMIHIMSQKRYRESYKSLFQHRGLISSLVNKTQKLVDKSFRDNEPLRLAHVH